MWCFLHCKAQLVWYSWSLATPLLIPLYCPSSIPRGGTVTYLTSRFRNTSWAVSGQLRSYWGSEHTCSILGIFCAICHTHVTLSWRGQSSLGVNLPKSGNQLAVSFGFPNKLSSQSLSRWKCYIGHSIFIFVLFLIWVLFIWFSKNFSKY